MSRPLLAIAGGTPSIPDGPPTWPPRDPAVEAALQQAFQTGDWGRYHGPHVERFETALAAAHGVEHCQTCCSGTLAVELALRARRIGAGDEVILAAYDFPGNFRAIEAIGACPVLVDIDPAIWCLDPSAVSAAVTEHTKAIVVSHLHGGLADMATLREIAERNALTLIEDACQASGAVVQGRPAGTWGDLGCFSFGGSKLLTAGRGGALIGRQSDDFQRAKIFRERGNDAFPLSELQAAVLLPQLQQLALRNELRFQRVTQLCQALQDLDALTPVAFRPDDHPAFYKVAFRFDSAIAGCDRETFLQAIRSEGVALDSGFRGFTRRGTSRCRRSGELTASEQAAQDTVILHHPVLLESSDAIDLVSQAVHKVLQHFGPT